MIDKTLNSAIVSPSATKTESTTRPGKAAQPRPGTVVKDDAATDKAVEFAGAPNKHLAPKVATAPLSGVQAPAAPRKIKSTAMNLDQRAALTRELTTLKKWDRAYEVASVAQGKVASFKEPSVLEFTASDGENQRWIISPTLRHGGFGKFRVAVLDTPEDQPTVVRAVKEYRLDERKSKEQISPSLKQRQKAIKSLVWITKNHGPRMAGRALDLIEALNSEEHLSRAMYKQHKEYLERMARQINRPLPPQIVAPLELKPKTRHSSHAEILEEGKLFALADSPLQVVASVERDGRVYNFSKLMRGELMDVLLPEPTDKQATPRMLTDEERRLVARNTAREATGRLADMHAHNMIHRDIKPENLFLDDEGHAQLGDWNLATRLTRGKASGAKGTLTYMSPEVVGDHLYGKAVDVYSLGLTLAMSSMNFFLVDAEETHFFREATSKALLSSEHQALGHVIDRLRFDDKGHLIKESLDEVTPWYAEHRLPYAKSHDRLEVIYAMNRMLERIKLFDEKDPQLCGPVLNLMLRHDPKQRADAPSLHLLFSDLQPTDGADAARAQSISRELLSQSFDVDDEIANLKAYGKAYGA